MATPRHLCHPILPTPFDLSRISPDPASYPTQESATMNLDRVDCGRDIPNDFNVIIEIPMAADPIK